MFTVIDTISNYYCNVFKKYKTIGKKYKKFYCVEELKSEVISKKHYKYGLKNFNDKEIELYSDIFGFLLDNDIQYYIRYLYKHQVIIF